MNKKIIFFSLIFILFNIRGSLVANLIIDDFEDGNFTDNLGGTWQAINDSGNGGNSTCSHILTNGQGGSAKAIRHSYTLGPAYQYRYTFEQVVYSSDKDFWTGYTNLEFWLRGDGHSLRIKFATPTTIDNYNYYGYTINPTPGSWTKYSIPLTSFSQENWGPGTYSNTPSHRERSLKAVREIQFVANSQISGETGWFEIDNISLLGSGPVTGTNCQIGAFVDADNNGTTLSDIDSYESLINRNLASVMIYINWGNGTNNNFPITSFNIINSNGSVPHIVWEPWLSSLGVDVSILDNILAGKYDSYITSFANSAKNWGKPFWLRFAHEMNGNWYGWSGAKNGGNLPATSKYTQVWHYVWNKFQAVGATNVAWVWSPNNINVPNESWNAPENYYPGDSYVNWLGMEGYNWYTNNDGSINNQTFDQIFSGIYTKLNSINSSKPIMVSEFASEDFNTGTSKKSNWIIDAFNKIKMNYQRVKCYNWFHINKERNWRIDSPNAGNPLAIKIAMTDTYFTSVGDPFTKGVLIPSQASFIDDFEDGDWIDKLGGTWIAVNDSANGGNSTAEKSFTNGQGGSTYSAKFKYTLGPNYQYRYAFLTIDYGSFYKDFSSYKSINFWLHGSGHKLRVIIVTTNIKDYDYYGYTINATPTTNWKFFKLNLTDFAQEGWGTPKPFDLAHVKEIQFKAASQISGESGWFRIDNISFGTDISTPPPFAGVIDTFEDGDLNDNNTGIWQGVNDSGNGGNSFINVKITNHSFEGLYAIHTSYTLGPNYQYRYVFLNDVYGQPKDYSQFKNISFAIKGSGHKLRVNIGTTNINDYDYYGYNLGNTPSNWTVYTLYFSQFKQEGWGVPKSFDTTCVKEFQFKPSSQISGEKGWFIIDNIVLGTQGSSTISLDTIDNFEDGDGNNMVGGIWISVDDSANGGNSTVYPPKGNVSSWTAGGNITPLHSAYFEYTLGPSYQYRYAFLSATFPSETDLTSKSNISFWIKGSGHKMRVVFKSAANPDADYYGFTINSTPSSWTACTMNFKNLKQEGWGTPIPLTNALKRITEIQFKAASQISGEHGYFWLDDIKLGNTTIVDTTPPGGVTGFSVITNGSDRLKISWTNPSDIDFAGVKIYRTTNPDYDWEINGNPVDAYVFFDSSVVYNSSGNNFVDTNLEAGVKYYYFSVTYDWNGNTNKQATLWSNSSRGYGVPYDNTPPPAPVFIEYFPYPSKISNANILKWRNPTIYDFAGTIVVRKTNGYSASPSDGEIVYNGLSTTFTDYVAVGPKYYYTLFSYDEVTNYSITNSSCKASEIITSINISNITTISKIECGKNFSIEAIITGSGSIRGFVYYRFEGESSYKIITMLKDGDKYSAEISTLGKAGKLYYYIIAKDEFNNEKRNPEIGENQIEILPPSEDEIVIYNSVVDFSKGESYAKIRFNIKSKTPVKVNIKIYSLYGQLLKELITDKEYTAGIYEVPWDVREKNGKEVSSGIYLVRIEAGEFKAIKKIMVIK
jgi:beta-mannanase